MVGLMTVVYLMCYSSDGWVPEVSDHLPFVATSAFKRLAHILSVISAIDVAAQYSGLLDCEFSAFDALVFVNICTIIHQ